MKSLTLTSTPKKIDLIRRVAKEMGINTKPFHELTDEEMALPGPKVSKEQLEDWLAKDDGEGGYTSAQMKARLAKRMSKNKSRKNGNHLQATRFKRT